MLKKPFALRGRLRERQVLLRRPAKKRRGSSSGQRPEPLSFVYGPVPSRRLGFSLGVDIIPSKTCSFNCVYCQLGRTPKITERRRKFFPARNILAQLRRAIDSDRRIDHITFSGSGEPTLNVEIGKLIRQIKKTTAIPVAVLTNSSLLSRKSVRLALLAADVVVPSLDAAAPATFKKVNRPGPSLELENIIESLVKFRREFNGRLWLEVMLVKGLNDSPEDIEALKAAVARIRPDKVQLNTVVRPPAEKWARPLSRSELERIKNKLGKGAEIIAEFHRRPQKTAAEKLEEGILSLTARRPVTSKDLAAFSGESGPAVRRAIEALLRNKRLKIRKHKGVFYYEPAGARLSERKR